MVKQSIFGRIAQLTRANVNALIDQAEDPQKMLDQMVRDFTNSIAEAESAVAQTIGNLRMMQDDYNEDVENARSWGNKALAASRKADEYRASGDTADAQKFDNLAKVAIQRQIAAENEAKGAEPTIASQTEIVDKLKDGLNQMRGKLGELTTKRDQLIARSRTAQAQQQVHDAVKSIDFMDPTSEVGRFEEKIRREEARVRGQQELASSSLDAQFESLEDLGEQTEIEARLAALKSGSGTQSAIGQGTGSETPTATPLSTGETTY
ncbi:PspA/IM30 family protein [Arthrobacter sp. NamB2]|uniref:PspA/IM30 family protein n=1 Tax=Arthrobacter sp. NamB2 TaxID=2576035 RepID=UPI0010C980B2|nr:PspA/IM30 family protein [Arthrobacter sp. NamB2]TKV29668.1 PspA/IM30 family protein [Arthrobacter sp. NamB2]